MRSLPLYLVALSRTISVGIATATQQPLYLSAFNAIPRVSSLFSTTKNHDEARMDGRIQAKDLLSSHFGPYGWPGQSFDYVIVGGGTAGLAMAKRLSEDNANSVAVIEAGGFYEIEGGNMTEVPMYLFNYFFDNGHVKNPLFDWYQYTVPQPGLAKRAMFYMQGKTLGGSTARGAMLYHRGSKGAYKKWAEQVGDDAYTWDNWLPYFQKSVKFSGPNTNPRPANATAVNNLSAFSESGGPVHVAYPYWTNAISSWVDKALAKLGFPEVQGFSDGNLLGRSYITHTINPYTRRRDTASTSYLHDALLESNNLNFYTRTLVKKILFDDKKKATGVKVSTDGFEWTIGAKKEVILSAGVMRSPQLLMVSGIGPRDTLEKLDIPVLSDRPGVGKNMQDTIILGPTNPVKVESHSQLMGSKETLPRSIYEYNNFRTGLLTNPGQDYFAFEKHQPGMLKDSTAADIEKEFPEDWPTFSYIALDDTFVPQYDGKNYFSMSAALMATFSRGSVTINSTDTAQNPIVDPRWLDDPRDKEMAVAAFRRCRAIVASETMQEVIDGPEILPGERYQTDEEIYNYIAETSDAYYAGVGTCAMGKKDDPNAVVDSNARVLGVDGLRVVDASAFPFAIDGQPMGTVYALAEKIAADILAGK
ncbi:Putative GMC oxidoreductase possibly involved in aflatoxin biosynthesis, member of the aflatoxin cluster [Podospora comata]|uniref:GMC oxidoreductase possibly involved in aflatoxin biosynthesis, member of the aflatoxin cluster n=1 Tax=Podospora comata TaxID=48703 RepID=A0ABY6S2P4_PODCO|nr:Putative GMC oxidoreductase possibly involved in aflatoxin biosynthesis, member of the aflatoxin cluster [Podospora comata]